MKKEKDQGAKDKLATVKPVKGTHPAPGATNDSFSLQRTLGNQKMQRLLKSGGLQAKLRVSQSGDAEEQEADRAAEYQARHSIERTHTLIVEDDAPALGPGQMRKRKPDGLKVFDADLAKFFENPIGPKGAWKAKVDQWITLHTFKK